MKKRNITFLTILHMKKIKNQAVTKVALTTVLSALALGSAFGQLSSNASVSFTSRRDESLPLFDTKTRQEKRWGRTRGLGKTPLSEGPRNPDNPLIDEIHRFHGRHHTAPVKVAMVQRGRRPAQGGRPR